MLTATSWSAAGRFSAAVGTFVVTALLVLLATPEDFGRFIYVQSIAFVVANISLVGINISIVSFHNGSSKANEKYSEAELTRSALMIGIAGAFFFSSLVAIDELGILAKSYLVPSSDTIPLAACWSFTWSLRLLSGGLQKAKGNIRNSAMSEAIVFNSSLVSILAVAFLADWSFQYSHLIILCNVLSLIALSPGVAGALWSKMHKFSLGDLRAKQMLIRPVLSESYPLLMAGVIPRIAAEAGLWIVANRCSLEDAACYGLAFRASQLVNLPVSILASVLLPVFAKLQRANLLIESQPELRSVFQLNTLIGFSISALIIAGIPWVPSFNTPAYDMLFFATCFLCMGRIAMMVFGPADLLLSITGNPKPVFYVVLICELTTLAISLAMVSQLGLLVVAATAGTLLAIRAATCWFITKSIIGFRTDSLFVGRDLLNPKVHFRKIDSKLRSINNAMH